MAGTSVERCSAALFHRSSQRSPGSPACVPLCFDVGTVITLAVLFPYMPRVASVASGPECAACCRNLGSNKLSGSVPLQLSALIRLSFVYAFSFKVEAAI